MVLQGLNCEHCGKSTNTVIGFSHPIYTKEFIGVVHANLCVKCSQLGKEYLTETILKQRARVRGVVWPTTPKLLHRLL